MRKGFLLTAYLLLAFAFSLPALAGEDDVWRASAQAEAEREGYRLIDSRGLNSRIEAGDVLVLDARADYEFAAGHIPGAVNLEFDLGDRMDLSTEKRKAFRAVLGPDTSRPVAIYCRSFR